MCSVSKVFEKLILNRILEVQNDNKFDLTGKNRDRFKHKRSTSTISIELQNLIARALVEDKSVLLMSLDLSSAFDIVNIKLLLTRLHKIGLSGDLMSLNDV